MEKLYSEIVLRNRELRPFLEIYYHRFSRVTLHSRHQNCQIIHSNGTLRAASTRPIPSEISSSHRLTDGDLRLADGGSSYEGRLEIYHSGEWGTICDDYFDLADAHVACRQLGFTTAQAVRDRATYGYADSYQRIWLDNVDCNGDEARLEYCWNRGWGQENCNHNEDVGVICTYSQPSEGALRLVDGEDLDEGRVEIYHAGVWGTICNDYWGYDEARVACRQLEYGGVTYSKTSMYGPGTGPIHLDNVQCWGYEDSLLQCYTLGWGNHNCGHNEDVGINCARPTDNNSLEGWAISLIVIGSLLLFGIFAAVIGKLCSKPRSKRNASRDAVSTVEPAPMQTYPVHVTTTYPAPAASTAPYPPNTMAFQAYPPTVTGAQGTAPPPAYTAVPGGAEAAYPPAAVNMPSPDVKG